MSDTEGEATITPIVLTEDQKAFLKECEEKYVNRFTKDDEEFMELYNKELSTPPIMPSWRANQGGRRDRRWGDRRDDRGGDRRGDRGGDRRDDRSYGRDNRDYRQSGDNYHDRGYRRSHDDRNGERSSYGGGNNYRQDNSYYRDNRH